jgi:hypothetical protein
MLLVTLVCIFLLKDRDMIYTTLNKIREQEPCSDGWKKLLTHLGKTQADDEPLSLLTILESNGLYDALWCLRACDGIEKEARLYAIACARRVQHLMKDLCSINALDVAERYAHGNATNQELNAARATAWGAAWYAASDAANAAASDAADAAAWYVARVAVYAAARAEAWVVARAIETDWQEAEFRKVFCS